MYPLSSLWHHGPFTLDPSDQMVFMAPAAPAASAAPAPVAPVAQVAPAQAETRRSAPAPSAPAEPGGDCGMTQVELLNPSHLSPPSKVLSATQTRYSMMPAGAHQRAPRVRLKLWDSKMNGSPMWFSQIQDLILKSLFPA